MHYLTKKLKELNAAEQQKVAAEILSAVTAEPSTKADKIRLVSMLDYTDAAKEYLKNWGKMQGLSTGYITIDHLTKGLVPGELIVVAGKTSYGKTSLCVNIANNIALHGKRVLFVTMEMTKEELTGRFMKINNGDNEDYYQVAGNTVYQHNDELDWTDIDHLIAKAKHELHVDLVVIDHLHYFSRETEKLAEDLGRITKELKKNAIAHKVPIILVSHVRKTGKGESATMDDLRGSSYIAQDADIVLMVGRNPENDTEFKVRIEKNRNRGFRTSEDRAELQFDGVKLSEVSVYGTHQLHS